MSRVAVTGAAGPVGSRLLVLLSQDPTVEEIVAIDRVPLVDPPTKVVAHCVALVDAELDQLLAGVDVVCHLAGADPLEGTVDRDLATTVKVLDAAGRAAVDQVIVRTSATVYGAWPDNPIPLTESAPLRPNTETAWVRVRATIEDRIADFAGAHPSIAVAVLRPCVTVSPEGPDELGRILAAARLVSSSQDAPPAQFVHVDDVAAACDVVRHERGEGVFNVAPDGALDAEMVRALVGGSPRIPLPEAVARRLTAFGWRYQLAPTPPGFLPFVTNPWVVNNDRLGALGWKPAHTNEEAFVAGHAAAPWAQISPQRRQEIALGVAVVVLVGAVVALVTALRRRLRRSSPAAHLRFRAVSHVTWSEGPARARELLGRSTSWRVALGRRLSWRRRPSWR